jgi:hypothetical protein
MDLLLIPHASTTSCSAVIQYYGSSERLPLLMLQMACCHSDIATTRSYCMTTEEEMTEAMKDW